MGTIGAAMLDDAKFVALDNECDAASVNRT